MSNYSLLPFEPVYNLHRGIYKLLKECAIKYSSSDTLNTDGVRKGRKAFVIVRARVLQGCNLLLSTIEGSGKLPGTRIEFSREGCSNASDGIFSRTVVRGTLEGKYYNPLDRVFPFVTVFINQSTEHEKTAPRTRAPTGYSAIVADVTRNMWQRMK